MYTLKEYNGLRIVTPDPVHPGGLAANDNFKALSTHIDTFDPTVSDDSTLGFSAGSHWYNSTTSIEWICLDATAGSAQWQVATAGVVPGGRQYADSIQRLRHIWRLGESDVGCRE